MIEDLRLSGLSLWDQGLIQDIENILADKLKFGFDLLTVVADGGNVLVSALGLFLLLDGRDNAPGSTSGAHYKQDIRLSFHGNLIRLILKFTYQRSCMQLKAGCARPRSVLLPAIMHAISLDFEDCHYQFLVP